MSERKYPAVTVSADGMEPVMLDVGDELSIRIDGKGLSVVCLVVDGAVRDGVDIDRVTLARLERRLSTLQRIVDEWNQLRGLGMRPSPHLSSSSAGLP